VVSILWPCYCTAHVYVVINFCYSIWSFLVESNLFFLSFVYISKYFRYKSQESGKTFRSLSIISSCTYVITYTSFIGYTFELDTAHQGVKQLYIDQSVHHVINKNTNDFRLFRFTVSNYPFGILDLRLLITPLVS
jgi:hypothetical protein